MGGINKHDKDEWSPNATAWMVLAVTAFFSALFLGALFLGSWFGVI